MRAALLAMLLAAPCQATTVLIPTVVTFGQDATVDVVLIGGEQIAGGSLDVGLSSGQIVDAFFGENTIWPVGTPVLVSPPTPPLPAQRSVFNLGLVGTTTTASGIAGRLVLNLEQSGVIVPNVQFSQIVQLPPDDLVQRDAVFLPGVIVVLPPLPDDATDEQRRAAEGFAEVLELLIDLAIYGRPF